MLLEWNKDRGQGYMHLANSSEKKINAAQGLFWGDSNFNSEIHRWTLSGQHIVFILNNTIIIIIITVMNF